MKDRNNLMLMGFTGKPHGIKGELNVKWLADFLPEPGDNIYLEKEKINTFKLDSSRYHNGRLLLSFAGVTDRTIAEALAGSRILIDRSLLPPLEEEEYYLADLFGCNVVLENGTEVGVLDHAEFPAEQEIWSILQKDGTEILFPAREEFIINIDPANRKIVINPPDGLLEIYHARTS